MTAISDPHEVHAVSDEKLDAQALLGAVMLSTVVAVPAAGFVFGDSAAPMMALVMLPLLIFASVRADIDGDTAYAGFAQ